MCGVFVEKEEIEKIFVGLAVEAQKQIPASVIRPKKRVIVLAGPTGVGKSALGHILAKEVYGEIISADSMQIFRGMDIGTAKPTKLEREELPYHLVDIRNVIESFNVVDFYYEARHICQEIHGRESIPIVVGGSGFYLHSLIYGPPSGPPSVPELRKRLEEEFESLGPDTMFLRLMQLDIEYARTITKNDKQKIVRALEIIELTGKKVSKLSWKGRRKPQNYDFRCWFIHRPKERLYHRLDKRCDKMIEDGLVDEVKALAEAGILQNSSASQAIGYKQVLEYLNTAQTKGDFDRMVEKFKQASRNYAKRQFTWFKKEPLFRWIDLEAHDPEVVLDIIKRDYECGL